MFISALDLFKVGIGPSSSHTMGPMVAAGMFRRRITRQRAEGLLPESSTLRVQCVLKGSLAWTGKGHATDRAIVLGMQGYTPRGLIHHDVNELMQELWAGTRVDVDGAGFDFVPEADVIFDRYDPLPEHPNGMIFRVVDDAGQPVLERRYFSIGGGFVTTEDDIDSIEAPLMMEDAHSFPFPFESGKDMLHMSAASGLSIAGMKRENEHLHHGDAQLDRGLDEIWSAMKQCVENGLGVEGTLPGGLNVRRRAKQLYRDLHASQEKVTVNDWLCAYAMAVNEENAAGHMVVTAPTNGAAGVIPSVLYYMVKHERISREAIHDYLLTAGAIGGLIKHRSSISGAEVGCQGEVGSASAMAAAALCAIRGGSVAQVENAAEIALEHHLGLTCDPVAGLVQVPCIERNGFGAIKAFTAASLALRGSGHHVMTLDACISAMKHTGEEMSHKFKETSLGGLAVSITEC
ncbi:MAG: L-serine ammonia-lyase [Bacteroidetes bacterium]|nr:L-serine ammonia-lyase [Bacteroidota bacterium]